MGWVFFNGVFGAWCKWVGLLIAGRVGVGLGWLAEVNGGGCVGR